MGNVFIDLRLRAYRLVIVFNVEILLPVIHRLLAAADEAAADEAPPGKGAE